MVGLSVVQTFEIRLTKLSADQETMGGFGSRQLTGR